MPLLSLRDVTRTVVLPDGSDLRILRGVNLEVEAGEHISIVGRSGTGKSTLLNLIGMLDTPNSGSYMLDGVDTLKLSVAKRASLRGDKFGFVFQQFNIFPTRTALENVEVPLLYAADKRFWMRHRLASEMLERVGLGDRLESYPAQMSGGEQQRIAIARCLVRKPKVILADEPTGALDPDTGQAVMALLEEVAREQNSALIVITHDMRVAQRAGRVYTLADGVLHDVNVFDDDETRPVPAGLERTVAMPGAGGIVEEAEEQAEPSGAALADSTLADSTLADSEQPDLAPSHADTDAPAHGTDTAAEAEATDGSEVSSAGQRRWWRKKQKGGAQ